MIRKAAVLLLRIGTFCLTSDQLNSSASLSRAALEGLGLEGTIDSKHANSHSMWRMWRCSAAANVAILCFIVSPPSPHTHPASFTILALELTTTMPLSLQAVLVVSPLSYGRMHVLLRGTQSQDMEVAHALIVGHAAFS